MTDAAKLKRCLNLKSEFLIVTLTFVCLDSPPYLNDFRIAQPAGLLAEILADCDWSTESECFGGGPRKVTNSAGVKFETRKISASKIHTQM